MRGPRREYVAELVVNEGRVLDDWKDGVCTDEWLKEWDE